jgi:methyl-accepting chemotaxis protein
MQLKSKETRDQSTMLIMTSLFVSFLLLLTISILIITSVTRPIRKIVAASEKLANGELDVELLHRGRKDEIGVLSDAFSDIVDVQVKLIKDINDMGDEHEKGDMDARISAEDYRGAFRDVTNGINSMVNAYISMMRDIFSVLAALADGDFNVTIPEFPGKKYEATRQSRIMIDTLGKINDQIIMLAKAGIEGRLSVRAEHANFNGGWQEMLKSLNGLVDSVVLPINSTSEIMSEMAKGNLSVRVNEDFKGDFAHIKNSLNSMGDFLQSYVSEISLVLGEISNSNLNINITREYVGDFNEIKTSFLMIIDKLNNVFGEINSASEQVSAGAKQVSESSMTLAEGATEQASSVQELSATIATIDEQTEQNAKAAKHANELSEETMKNASDGNSEMSEMLTSMEGIRDSSNSISKVIKVIDDIAFQTNLLALNAAVEAARAGVHGKGFAVVAEEVRNLAIRSQNAARETTELIETSISRVSDGTIIANKTASALEKIVEDIAEVSKLISEISRSSIEQADAVSQVTVGINQISDVVQSNSATSEESASASQELSGQAETLKNMVSVFRLKAV